MLPRPARPLQITYHFLQCIFQHAHLTRGAAGAGAPASAVKAEGGYGGAAPEGGYGAPAPGGMAGGYNPNSGLTAIQVRGRPAPVHPTWLTRKRSSNGAAA